MFQWIKKGKIFTPQQVIGLDWLKEFAQAPSTLILDDVVRVYFSCRPLPDVNGQYVSHSAFVDLDRKNLYKIVRVSDQPILPMGDVGAFDEFGIYPVSVIKKNQGYMAYYAGWTRCESVPFNVAIGCAESDDGMHFKKIGSGPVLGYSLHEPFVISGPKIRYFNGRWYLFYIAGTKWKIVAGRPEPVYKIRMAVSDDGLNWDKNNRDLIESRIEDDEAQASPDVIFSNGKYHMFFCYRHSENYRSKEFGYRIGYASSENLIDWTRDDEKAGINVSDHGWDAEMVSYPHVFELDGKIYMFYLGDQVGKFGFGMAELDGILG